MKTSYIAFIDYNIEEKTEDSKIGNLQSSNIGSKYFKVSEELLKKNLKEFISTLKNIISEVDEKNDTYSVSEIELNVDVSLNGDIKILKAGIKSGITIKLKRQSE